MGYHNQRMQAVIDKSLTFDCGRVLSAFVVVLAFGSITFAQSAASLDQVRRVYVGSLGDRFGASELRQELIRNLVGSKLFVPVRTAGEADASIDGKGELWIRGYRSLSPRARTNANAADPVYGGYLSVKVHGKGGEILWSYFADPPKVSYRGLRQDLVREVVSRMALDRDRETGATALPPNGNEAAAILHGAGATFPYPIYLDWFVNFHNRHPAWTIDYLPVGSEAGVDRLADSSMDFAGTDIPPGDLKARIQRGSISFPTVGGAVVLAYNLPGFVDELRLTPESIASIYSGRIQLWNDPVLKALNSTARLPNARIQTLYRLDGSGTTFALTDFLSKADARWKTTGPAWRFPSTTGRGITGNEAVAEAVAATPFSFGYVELIYAVGHRLSFASIRNRSGRFVQPDLLSIMAAANGAGDKQEYLSLSITDSPDINSYPISTFSWLVVPGDLEPAKRKAMSAFLEWMLTSGQRECSALGYAPLPRNLVDLELKTLSKIK